MKTAIQLGYRQDSPCEGVALPKSTATDDTMMFLSEDEFALLETNMTPSYQLFTRFLVMTGLRWGEATALLVSDLNLKGKPPSVRVTKAWKHDGDNTITSALRRRPGRGARSPCRGRWLWTSPTTLPASPPTIWYSATVGDSGVTHGNFHKKHWTNAINAAFGRVDKDGKFVVSRRPRIHDLRHTHASWMLAEGLDITVLQRRLGHETITTTIDRYTHLAEQHERSASAADRLMDRLGARSSP